jgi:hypothetical protein
MRREYRPRTVPILQTWEFHDLLFHAHSRDGRHSNRVGATYRFAGRLASPPALKRAEAARVGTGRENSVDLYRPVLNQLERNDPPFARVQESRRSIRDYALTPISNRQLGEFLFRIGRVEDYWQGEAPTSHGPITMEFAARPYPMGGALYELELYAAVNACDGLEAGPYYYDPAHHRLDRLRTRCPEVERLMEGAGRTLGNRG